MNKLSEELKPCPFCGGKAEINQIGNEYTRSRGFEVKCLTWGCATKKRAMVIRQPTSKAREFAITAWNTRSEALSSPGAGRDDIARCEGGAGRCGTCHHFTPERDGFGSCARWAQGYGSQDLAPNEVCVENDEGWGMIMGADFGCVLYLPAESGASSPAEGRAGTLPPEEHIPPPNPVSHEGEA